jgi:hypothetical protein
MKRLSVVMIVVIVLGLLLSACGGGGGGAGPAAAAKSFFDAFTQLDFAKMKDLTCEAQKATMDEAAKAMSVAGDAAALKELIKIDTSGLKFEEKSVSGNNATVVITGKMKMEAFGQTQEQDLNSQELPMVNEGGAWKVCAAGGLPIQ